MSRARLTSKGQITIPKDVRDRLGVDTGDELDFHFEGDRLEVRPVRRRRIAEFRGLFPAQDAPNAGEERTRAWDARARELTSQHDSSDA